MKLTSRHILTAAASLVLALQAQAIVITPSYTSFGTLAAATFGGSGIPNDAVAITTVGGITIGLTAHQRGDNVAVSNNGAGKFTAAAGADVSTAPAAVAGYATWNFGYYISGLSLGQTATLYFDTNPAAGNDVTSTISSLGLALAGPQNSWNLGMSFLGGAAFPESSTGEYGFALVVNNALGGEVARSAILVNAVSSNTPGVPDSGVTAAMLGLGLCGAFGLRRFVRA